MYDSCVIFSRIKFKSTFSSTSASASDYIAIDAINVHYCVTTEPNESQMKTCEKGWNALKL